MDSDVIARNKCASFFFPLFTVLTEGSDPQTYLLDRVLKVVYPFKQEFVVQIIFWISETNIT